MLIVQIVRCIMFIKVSAKHKTQNTHGRVAEKNTVFAHVFFFCFVFIFTESSTDIYDYTLTLPSLLSHLPSKFYTVQLLKHNTTSTFFLFTKWGRLTQSFSLALNEHDTCMKAKQ